MAPSDKAIPDSLRLDSDVTGAVSESQVLERLAKDTGAKVNESERAYLMETGRILEATEEGNYAECLGSLRSFRRLVRADNAARGVRRGGARTTQAAGGRVVLWPVGTPEELERARVFSKYLARVAAEEWDTSRFRRGFFGDAQQVIPPRAARAIVESPSLHYLLPEFFRETGIPRLNHRSRLLARDHGFDRQLRASTDTVTLELEWDRGHIEHTERVLLGDRHGHEFTYLEYPDRDFKLPRLPVRRGGCLWWLLLASRRTSQLYWWSEAESTWFLLTGAVPSVHPVQASISGTMRGADTPLLTKVSIRVLPFASAATVKKAYLGAIKWMSRRQRGPAVRISNLRLFEFVEDWRGVDYRKPQWAELMRLWNATVRPDWRYSHRSHLRGDYLRTRDLVTKAALPEPPPLPRARTAAKRPGSRNKAKGKRGASGLGEAPRSRPDRKSVV